MYTIHMKSIHAKILIAMVCIAGVSLWYATTKSTLPATPPELQAVTYTNEAYGFYVDLPESWKGYTVVEASWEGVITDTPTEKKSGPEIFIRHPLWTKDVPRQDIPIMIFTPNQWALIVEEKMSLGAAPIGPRELARNNQYIFALPARYNFAFPLGFEEVENIIERGSVRAL